VPLIRNLSLFSHSGWPVPKNIARRYLTEIEFRQTHIKAFYSVSIILHMLLLSNNLSLILS
jgi:hypothetical protein